MIKFIPKIVGFYLNTINWLFPRQGGIQTFYLFCYPFKATLTPKHQAWLDTAQRTDINVDGQLVPALTDGGVDDVAYYSCMAGKATPTGGRGI